MPVTKPKGHKRGQVTRRQMEAVAVFAVPDEPPSLPEAAQKLGLRSESGVRDLLQTPHNHLLVEWIHAGRGPASNKVLRVTERGMAALAHFGMLPKGMPAPGARVLAKDGENWNLKAWPVSCGCLKEACAEPRYVMGPADYFPNYRDGDYLLDADGDSMEALRRDSIWRGDRCLMRPDIFPGEGEIAHVSYVRDGVYECTLKEFHHNEHEGVVTLHAFNPKYEDIVLPAVDVRVHGVLMNVLRQPERK